MSYPAKPRQSGRIVTTNAEGSAEAEVADYVSVGAKGRIICNVNQECMFRFELLTSGNIRNVNEDAHAELSIIYRKRKLRKTEDETNRADTCVRERHRGTQPRCFEQGRGRYRRNGSGGTA